MKGRFCAPVFYLILVVLEHQHQDAMTVKPSFWKQITRHQRRWYGKVHTLAGLSAGLILIIVSLTGALLVFEEELDVWLHPGLFDFEEIGEILSFQEVTERVLAERPTTPINGVFLQKKRNNAYVLFLKGKEVRQMIVNPYNGKIMGVRVYGKTPMGFIRNLHRTLLIPKVGKYLTGISALCCTFLMITGLRLWLPKRWKNLRARLGIRWHAARKRVNYDLHNTLGFYFSPAIALIALTGVMITFSQVILLFLFLLSFEPPVSIEKIFDQKSDYVSDQAPIEIQEAVRLAEAAVPGAKVRGFILPRDSVGAYNMNLVAPARVRTGDHSIVFLDQYSGRIINTSEASEFKLTKAYLNWVTPIHYGSFAGLPTRILALVASLVTVVLIFSGFYIWLGRWRKRQGLGQAKAPATSSNSKLQKL